jgi:S-adenosylmethionine:tRNA ribosyltransferase-isomerase
MQVATPSFLHHALRLSDFDYEYPRDLIAAYPAEPREQARMMVVDRAAGTVAHRHVADLVDYFGPGDVLVVNDTKVFPARLNGEKETTGARVEVFLLRELNAEKRFWDALVDPARKIRVGNKLYFQEGLSAEVIDNTTSRGRTLRFIFDGSPEAFYDLIDRIGNTPIPQYIRRPVEPEDRDRYQTVFARQRGAVAAPTAGLHFTPDLVASLAGRGVEIVSLTLHTGLGSFQPVEIEDVTKHRVPSEYFEVSAGTAEVVNRALRSSTQRVTACGTTVVRTLETSLTASRELKASAGWTDKFMFPPCDFHVAQRMLTNFHRPRSTPLMMTSAFAGLDLLRHAYEEAVAHEYRLFSFGDAMLIL